MPNGPLERREGPLDRFEKTVEESGESARPVRESIEERLDQIPSGPLGKVGNGDAVGIAAFVAIRTGQIATLPIPGVKQPGFSVVSHGVQDMGEFERHSIRLNAASKDVAEFVAEYWVAAPSNIDWATSEVEVVSIEPVTERVTYTTWDVEVDVADRGQKEA